MTFVLGADEAGRGPLAGPVAVGVVMVPAGFDVAREFPGVADSKQLSEGKREELFAMLKRRAERGEVRYCVRFASAEVIDARGIVPAVHGCVARGCRALVSMPITRSNLVKSATRFDLVRDVHVMLDGALRAPGDWSQETIVGGDASVPLISLASIAAKVTRDRFMYRMARRYPEYGFERHKGYGTKLHYEMLEKCGPSAIHRRSYLHFTEAS